MSKSDIGEHFNPSTNRTSGFRPVRKLRQSWLVLLLALVFCVLAVYQYGVTPFHAGIAFFMLATAIATVPKSTKLKRKKVAKRLDLERIWPSAGMKAAVEALASPGIVVDAKGMVRFMNSAAEKAFKSGRVGEPLSFSLRAPNVLEAFDRVVSSGSPERISWMEKVPREAWYEASLGPIRFPQVGVQRSATDRADFVLVVITDTTEQRRLEKMRTDFVANASHELRTPLASLAGFIETLQGPAKNDPEARDRFLAIMFEQAGRMRRLIDDILSLSRIELKAHVRPDKDVDLVEILRHTADALAPLAKELEMEISVATPDGPVFVKGDRDELIQVSENLVENALKYGRSGKRVELTLSSPSQSEDVRETVLGIRDFGGGIPAEHLPRLTERFYRVDIDANKAQKGTGLGLAIVKHIVARHRARLDIESRIGEGSLFSVIFTR